MDHQEPSTRLHRSINQHTLNQQQLRIEIDEQHRLGFLNWLPLILVILPNLAPIFFEGEPESWRRSILFLLIVYFLYKISKAPWQLYASARTTRIFNQLGVSPSAKIIYPSQKKSHQDSLTELNRIEIGFLLLAMFSPAIGIGLLIYLQSKLDLGLDYLNSHSTLLFLLASLVKPLGHLHDRVLQRSRYLQSQLEFPTQSAEHFNESFSNLAFKLNQLELESLTKTELMEFKKNQIDLKLMEISNRLAQFEKSDVIYQSNSFDRLEKLERTLVQTRDKLEKTLLELDHLRFLNHHHHHHQHNSPLDSISKAFNQVLNSNHRSENNTNIRRIDQDPSSPPTTPPSSEDKMVKSFGRVQPNSSHNSTKDNQHQLMMTNLFKVRPGVILESMRQGFELLGHEIVRVGIRFPLTSLIKVITFLASFFYLILINPLQIFLTKTTTNHLQETDNNNKVLKKIITRPINNNNNKTRLRRYINTSQRHHERSTPSTMISSDEALLFNNNQSPPPSVSSSPSSSPPDDESPPLPPNPPSHPSHPKHQHHPKHDQHHLDHHHDPHSLYHLHH